MKNLFLLSVVTLLISSCASFYKPIDPHNFNYNTKDNGEVIDYDYKTDVLTLTGNQKYAKKEDKYGIDIVAVKIQNNTTEPINVKDDIDFIAGDRTIVPMESYLVEDNIKQRNIALYALYGLLTLNVERNGQQTIYPFGIGIAIGNIAVAASANSSFKKNFSEQNILNKTIQPGEVVYGLVAFRDLQSYKLEMKLLRD